MIALAGSWRAGVLLAVSLARPAFASGPELVLDWDAPADCPSHTEVLALVEQHLGRPIAVVESPSIRFAVAVESARGDYHVRFAAHRGGPAHPRSFAATRCPSAARAVALMIAVTIDPLRTAEQFDASTALPHPGCPIRRPRFLPATPRPARPSTSRRSRVRTRVRAFASRRSQRR